MCVNLTSLPGAAQVGIFKYFSNHSILSLREVSKELKDLVDLSIPILRRMNISELICERQVRKTAVILYVWDTTAVLWRIFVMRAAKELGITAFDIHRGTGLKCVMTNAQIKSFFDFTKSKLEGTMIKMLLLHHCSKDVLGFVDEFFNGRTVSRIIINCRAFNENLRTPCTQIIEHCTSERVHIHIDHLQKDSIKGLVCMSTIPKIFGVFTWVYKGFNTASVVQDFLRAKNSKCEKLLLNVTGAEIKRTDLEKLIQILHSTEKAVEIWGVNSNAVTMNAQIGMYLVAVIDNIPPINSISIRRF